ncbi:hypothetical protein FF38_13273 [Lucilia cuprina]|uniref:Uncharacterized protein n=1 Tax=Lucilia cuprina TaxID=7375 RepID=A0A0L0CHQ3_LUCCU|nr:hypothetical protein FF38_13273 [Lucilia cuprina]
MNYFLSLNQTIVGNYKGYLWARNFSTSCGDHNINALSLPYGTLERIIGNYYLSYLCEISTLVLLHFQGKEVLPIALVCRYNKLVMSNVSSALPWNELAWGTRAAYNLVLRVASYPQDFSWLSFLRDPRNGCGLIPKVIYTRSSIWWIPKPDQYILPVVYGSPVYAQELSD